jgi:heme-degrading monooxygenase HmoA
VIKSTRSFFQNTYSIRAQQASPARVNSGDLSTLTVTEQNRQTISDHHGANQARLASKSTVSSNAVRCRRIKFQQIRPVHLVHKHSTRTCTGLEQVPIATYPLRIVSHMQAQVQAGIPAYRAAAETRATARAHRGRRGPVRNYPVKKISLHRPKHNLPDSHQLLGAPMILELADIRIHPGQNAAFDEAIVRGLRDVISHSKGFQGFKINQGIENPERYVLQIFWDTLENHTVDFRQSDAFTQWRAIVGPFFAAPPVVEHFVLLTKSD